MDALLTCSTESTLSSASQPLALTNLAQRFNQEGPNNLFRDLELSKQSSEMPN